MSIELLRRGQSVQVQTKSTLSAHHTYTRWPPPPKSRFLDQQPHSQPNSHRHRLNSV